MSGIFPNAILNGTITPGVIYEVVDGSLTYMGSSYPKNSFFLGSTDPSWTGAAVVYETSGFQFFQIEAFGPSPEIPPPPPEVEVTVRGKGMALELEPINRFQAPFPPNFEGKYVAVEFGDPKEFTAYGFGASVELEPITGKNGFGQNNSKGAAVELGEVLLPNARGTTVSVEVEPVNKSGFPFGTQKGTAVSVEFDNPQIIYSIVEEPLYCPPA